MKADDYAKYRTEMEVRRDEERERHLLGECDEYCTECILIYMDENEQRCSACGSTDFTRDGDVERCAKCGR